MKNKKIHLMMFVLLLTAVILAGCGNGTTQTTNPIEDGTAADVPLDGIFDNNPVAVGEDGDPAYQAEATQVEVVLSAVCDVLATCAYVINDTTCAESLNTDEAFLEALGVDTASYASLDDVQTAIDEGGLSTAQTEVDACVAAVSAVTCAEMSALEVFDNADNGNFTRVFLMVPGGC